MLFQWIRSWRLRRAIQLVQKYFCRPRRKRHNLTRELCIPVRQVLAVIFTREYQKNDAFKCISLEKEVFRRSRLKALEPINFIQIPVALARYICGYCTRGMFAPIMATFTRSPVTKFSHAVAIKSAPLAISSCSGFFHFHTCERWIGSRGDMWKRVEERENKKRRVYSGERRHVANSLTIRSFYA